MAVDAGLTKAIAAHQAGRMGEAESLYRAVLARDPGQADACALLGVVIGARGDFQQAIEWADKAVSLDPHAGLLHFHRGTVLMAAQRLPEAVASLRLAAALLPSVAQIFFNLANALRLSGDWEGAIDAYRKVLALKPAFAEAMNNLALSLVHEKNFDEAFKKARCVTEQHPSYGEGWLTLCNVAEKVKDYAVALLAGEKVVALMPKSHYAWFGYGVALNRAGRDEEAIAAYRRALDLNPGRADIWDNLAQSYQALNRLDEADAAFRRAVDVAGQSLSDEDLREVEEEEYGGRHWHLALVELLRGDYRRGFARYRARFKEIDQLKRLSFPFPLWKGEDLNGKTLLVCDEQGYGDTLMLLRFLPLLRARGTKIVLSVHKVLLPLLQDWGGADAVIAHNAHVPACDYVCSSFDLPHRLGVTLDSLPHAVPYLPVLPPDEATRLPQGGFKVGVVWGGSPLHLNDAKRSVPLPVFADLFSVPDARFYCFNRDMKAGDAALLPSYGLENLVPRLTDFAVASRLAGQMDLMITCDTAMAHLVGGMGKPVWVLLPFAPDWRWLTDRTDSPWYPTARLFRQPKPGDWSGAVASARAALMNLVRL